MYKLLIYFKISDKKRTGNTQTTDMPFDSNRITILCTRSKQSWQCSKQNVQDNTEIMHAQSVPSYCNKWQLNHTLDIKYCLADDSICLSQIFTTTLLVTTQIHDFTAVIFSTKRGIICEKLTFLLKLCSTLYSNVNMTELNSHYSLTHRYRKTLHMLECFVTLLHYLHTKYFTSPHNI